MVELSTIYITLHYYKRIITVYCYYSFSEVEQNPPPLPPQARVKKSSKRIDTIHMKGVAAYICIHYCRKR